MQPPYDENNSGWTRVGGEPAGEYDPAQSFPGEGPAGAFQNPAAQVPPAAQLPPVVNPYAAGYEQPQPPVENSFRSGGAQTVHQVLDQQEYRAPSTGMSRGGRRKMKPAAVAILCVILLSLAILIIVGIASCTGGCGGRNEVAGGYARITYGNLEATYSGDALVVRNEVVYAQNGITGIDYIASEGGRVFRGDRVCTVYTAGFSSKELTTLQKYRDQIKSYHKTLLEMENVSDQRLISLENVVLARAVEAQMLVQGGRGNLIRQEELMEQAMQDRMVYLKQKYPDDQKLTRLYEDENSQEQKISSWTKQYAATATGLVSFYTDGYENVVNMDTYLSLQPAEVRKMITKAPEDPTLDKNSVSIYRLVKEDSWGVLMLCSNTDWTPEEGAEYQMVIESFENTTVTAQVVSYTKSGNEMLVRLRVLNPAESIGNVLYPRSCYVKLGERVDVLCIPAKALYEQQGTTGFIIVDERGMSWFEECQLVSQDRDMVYVIPKDKNLEWDGTLVKLNEN